MNIQAVKSAVVYRSQPAITCSKLTIESLEQGVKYVPCSSVSIVNFEQVNAGWDDDCICTFGGLLED